MNEDAAPPPAPMSYPGDAGEQLTLGVSEHQREEEATQAHHSSSEPVGDGNNGPVSDWRPLAACRGMSPDLFYPEDKENAPEAKATCRTCPVMDACLTDNLWEDHGIWGGTSPAERKVMRRGVRRPPRLIFCEVCATPVLVETGPRRYCSMSCRIKARRTRAALAAPIEEEGEVA